MLFHLIIRKREIRDLPTLQEIGLKQSYLEAGGTSLENQERFQRLQSKSEMQKGNGQRLDEN